MFRRFMIVCWVLLSLAALTALVGWGVYEYYDAEAKSYAAEYDPDGKLSGRIKLRNLLAEDEETQAHRDELNRLKDIRESFEELAGFGVVAAGVLLLWNIFCHTAHWILQGRKVE